MKYFKIKLSDKKLSVHTNVNNFALTKKHFEKF